MTIHFNRNTKPIKEVYTGFQEGNILVDEGYQRKKVWSDQDNVRFIETILLEMVIPEVFFWTAEVDPKTGDSLTHIVDGQQRISAITDYIDDCFPLAKKYLMDDQMKEEVGDKYFSELDDEHRTTLWQYLLPIVYLHREYDKDQIVEIFRRLNLTEYSLNAQERRHSEEDNAFGRKCEALAEDDFWDQHGVFSARDLKRMYDVKYCCTIYLLKKHGIIDQTDDTSIERAYQDYAISFDKDNVYEDSILAAMSFINKLVDDETKRFAFKKAQLYTLFSFAFYLLDNGIDFNEKNARHFRLFVMAYNLFKNEFEIDDEDPAVRQAYDAVKRYKLASSEGVNKGTNRTIRFNVMKEICIDNNNDAGFKTLINQLTAQELDR